MEGASFNPGRWSVRGLVFGTALFAVGVIVFLLGWGDPDNGLHMAAMPVAEWIIYADLTAFTGGVLGEIFAALRRK